VPKEMGLEMTEATKQRGTKEAVELQFSPFKNPLTLRAPKMVQANY